MTEFTHLHVHSEYSMLDGLSKVPELVSAAKANGMNAVALTDHGVLYGAIEFYEEAHKRGVKPIVGVEAYVAARRMTDKEVGADRTAAHLILLAQNDVGYRNLLALTTAAHLDGFYYKPRIDHDILAEHSEGLVVLSACASGEIPWALRQEDMASARRAAEFYLELFGRENYYLEMQSHGLDFQDTVNRGVLEIARDMNIKLVATNDSHYTARDDCAAQDMLLCIQTNSLFDDPKRMRAYTTEHYLKTPDEMALVFPEQPEALRNTMEVAEKCNLELVFGRLDFPKLPFVPEGESPQDFLSRMCWENLPRRYEQVTPQIEERLRYELDVVRTTGFPAYILFVWDFVDYARKQGILCGPRGSAAGSIILYLLGITTIDPIAHDLTFERFLNPERIQMPDIDMDFADTRRDEVIEYVANRYGRDHVAQIISFGRLLARAAIRDVGRALGYPLTEVDRAAKLIPTLPVGMTLDRALGSTPELKQLYDEQDHIRRLIDGARQVEGSTRHASTHAAGIVVSGEPLVRHVPLQKGARGENVIMTQYEMHALETIGLLKMDFLGLTNLTLLERALEIIEQTHGTKLDLQNLPKDDPKTYEMLSNGDSTGVFQLEGSGMRRTLREFRPSNVHHLAAIVALYRPGPMAHIPTYVAAKDGRQPISYLHPKLEPILKSTYGVIVYQDQVLQIVQAIAGFSLGQADILRRAMGKKIAEEMKRERDNFLSGARTNGVDDDVAGKIWEYIEPFAGYAFNKAHAYCYAYIAYQTAYLKCTYPAEYMAAMLSTQSDDTEKVVAAAGECRRLGISLLPPDVNRSQVGFSVEDDSTAVRFGLGAIKNVGAGAARLVAEEREAHGAYRSLDDICERIDLRTVNKRVLEALTKAGALDAFGPRESVLAALDRTMAAGQQMQKAAGVGQGSLFGFDDQMAAAPSLPTVPAVSDQQRLFWEKESLGFFLSNHPFEAAAPSLSRVITINTSQASEEMDGERATMAGAVMSIRKVVTKRGETMVIAQIEDLHGSIEAVVFPRTYALDPELWAEDTIVIVRGKITVRRIEARGEEDARGIPEIIVDTAEAWVQGEATAEELDPMELPALHSPPPPGGRELDTPPSASTRQVERTATIAPSLSTQVEGSAKTTASPSMGQAEVSAIAPSRVEAEGGGEGDIPLPPTTSREDDVQPAGEVVLNAAATRSETCANGQLVLVFKESGDRDSDLVRLRRLHATLASHPGDSAYAVVFEAAGGKRQLTGEQLRADFSEQVRQEVEAILGPGAIRS